MQLTARPDKGPCVCMRVCMDAVLTTVPAPHALLTDLRSRDTFTEFLENVLWNLHIIDDI